MTYVTAATVFEATGKNVIDFWVQGLGVTSSKSFKSQLSFLADPRYILEANANESIHALFVTSDIAPSIREGVIKIIVDDPKWFFFSVINYMALNKKREKTYISSSARVHSSAYIAEYGVIVENNVEIGPNVTIMEDVIVGDGVTIRAGAVVGVDGYEHKRTSRGMLSVAHDGRVILGKNVEIGVNSNVAKGFAYRDTVVGADSKIDALVHYAHGAQCGERCMIVASAMIAGHVTLGNDVWVGPNACISNRIVVGDGAFITLGAVVVRDVVAGDKVTGNFAIPHLRFIRNLKASIN